MTGKLESRLSARAGRAAEARAARTRAELARELDGLPGVRARTEGDAVVVNGRRLDARLAGDPAIRDIAFLMRGVR